MMKAITLFCVIALCLTSFHLLSAQSAAKPETADPDVPNLNVYPNPAYDLLKLQSDKPLDLVTIVDNDGERVKRVQRKQLAWKQIDMSDLPDGFYEVRLFSGEENKSFTVIKL